MSEKQYAGVYDDQGTKPWVIDMEQETLDNTNFRTTMWTGKHLQMTVMEIPVGGDIGLEVHHGIDQFLRVEQGTGKCQMGPSEDNLNFEEEVGHDSAIFVPDGVWHNVTNIGDEDLKVYSLYAPPEHAHGTVHPTKADDHHDH